jgi:hypothetical protein
VLLAVGPVPDPEQQQEEPQQQEQQEQEQEQQEQQQQQQQKSGLEAWPRIKSQLWWPAGRKQPAHNPTDPVLRAAAGMSPACNSCMGLLLEGQQLADRISWLSSENRARDLTAHGRSLKEQVVTLGQGTIQRRACYRQVWVTVLLVC